MASNLWYSCLCSASWVLGLQVCATIPSLLVSFVLLLWNNWGKYWKEAYLAVSSLNFWRFKVQDQVAGVWVGEGTGLGTSEGLSVSHHVRVCVGASHHNLKQELRESWVGPSRVFFFFFKQLSFKNYQGVLLELADPFQGHEPPN
jgi:hypothetical protein